MSQDPWTIETVPRHVAFIMDGNGRWARKRHLPRIEGHRNGAKTVRMVVEESRKIGIGYVTLFAFSSENWLRPNEEVSSLMRLFNHYLDSETDNLAKNGIRLRVIGDRSRLPESVREAVMRNEERTCHLKDMQLVVAVSYGGQDEIVEAVRKIAICVANGKISPAQITKETISENLYAPDVPNPDLLIRTSGECRISNFLLWQIAYSEIIISQALWPDFSSIEYRKCLEEFATRSRRFGMTEEQVQKTKKQAGV